MFQTHKELIAMLLAGGQGSRLKVLTADLAKPAVPFGGKYRIIDFPLSNCVNSGIDTVGILTQYQPLVLNDYIGNGQPWGLNYNNGGAHILPPYSQSGKSEWYKGTANAIYQNIRFIERYHPEYVLILSGDHIYKMDYAKMLYFHKKKQADCTIAVLEVAPEEASRFGIMNTLEDGRVYEFEEKPAHPKSTNASMGIYIFTWEVLREYLIRDEMDPGSSNDFGKDVIPALLKDGRQLFAYPFEGYWRDVGTIDSLWEANMDLLNPKVPFEMRDQQFKIYSRNYSLPSSFIAREARLVNAMAAEGCTIRGYVENSIVSTGCRIDPGARVRGSVLMPNVVVEEGAVVEYAIIGEGAVIQKGAQVGKSPFEAAMGWGIAVVGTGKTVQEGKCIQAKEVF